MLIEKDVDLASVKCKERDQTAPGLNPRNRLPVTERFLRRKNGREQDPTSPRDRGEHPFDSDCFCGRFGGGNPAPSPAEMLSKKRPSKKS